LGNALYALERLPEVTTGAYTEFGVYYKAEHEDSYVVRGIDFLISEDTFQISIGGSVYDKSVGGDSFSEPGWTVEVGGYRENECNLYNLEGEIEGYLNHGAVITVNDESNIDYQ
jgi:hypothetical protein